MLLFLTEIAMTFLAFALKDHLYSFVQSEMYASINSTKYEVMRTWSIVQKEVSVPVLVYQNNSSALICWVKVRLLWF